MRLFIAGILLMCGGIMIGVGIMGIIGNNTLVVEVEDIRVELSHRKETWISALEWCESSAQMDVINPKDKDGTPSYYSFQFKPDTFKMYGERYGLIKKNLSHEEIMEKMKDYNLSKNTMRKMVEDPRVKWEKEFPDCILRKIGRPPIQ